MAPSSWWNSSFDATGFRSLGLLPIQRQDLQFRRAALGQVLPG